MREWAPAPGRLRPRAWFDNPENPDMTALCIERAAKYQRIAQTRGLPRDSH
jgi:hypothetical protein